MLLARSAKTAICLGAARSGRDRSGCHSVVYSILGIGVTTVFPERSRISRSLDAAFRPAISRVSHATSTISGS